MKRQRKPESDTESVAPKSQKRPVASSSKPISSPPHIGFKPSVQHSSQKSARKISIVSHKATQRHAANVANKERISYSSKNRLKSSLETERNKNETSSKSPVVAKLVDVKIIFANFFFFFKKEC